MPETTSSPLAGATPALGPATGNTTAPSGATPEKNALTVDELLKRIADLEKHAQNKTEEAAHHGKKLTAAEKELASYKAAEEAARAAQMSELEKAQKQAADLAEREELLAAQLHDALVYQDVARYAPKFNFIVSVDTLAGLLLLRDERSEDSKIEFEGGKPGNVEKLLEKLAKAEPDLIKKEQTPRPPTLPMGNQGRTGYNVPGANPPGRIPRLDDPGMWKT